MLESVDNIPKKISLNKDLHFMKKIVSKNLKIFQRVQKKLQKIFIISLNHVIS